MKLKELVEKEGLENLQAKLQELVSSKVDDDKVVFTLEKDNYGINFVSSFPEDDDKYLSASMEYDEELDDDDCIGNILSYVAESYWDYYSDLGDELDSHQINCAKKLNNQ